MGNFASRIHSKEDGKVYNILPLGDMPTVVFGRVIREHSVPGMQYYFSDGIVKFKDGGKEKRDNMSNGGGWDAVIPYPNPNYGGKRGYPCIFIIPEDLDFSKMNDVEYVSQFCRTAKGLNANTMSPDFIIRDGVIICVRKMLIQPNETQKYGDSPNADDHLGNVLFKKTRRRSGVKKTRNNPRKYAQTISNDVTHCINNEFSIIPFIKRGSTKKYKSIYELNCFRYKRKPNKNGGWKWKAGKNRVARNDG